MIGRSLPEYVFILISIGLLRLVAPLSLLYLGISLVNRSFILTPWLSILAIPESFFYLFVYLPRRRHFQKPADIPPYTLTKEERKALFNRCVAYAKSSPSSYPMGWFLSTDIKRGNMEDWLLWALFSARREDFEMSAEIQDELDGYVNAIEEILGHKLEPGHNRDGISMRLPYDPVRMVHRPLIWYMIVWFVDTCTGISLMLKGFTHFAPGRWFQAFPPRAFGLGSRPAATQHFSYWFREHRSANKHPIIFIHGIGIGLYPYVGLINEIVSTDPDVGILLIELLPICMHLTHDPIAPRKVLLDAISETLSSLEISKAVLIAHSFGTVIASHILQPHPERPVGNDSPDPEPVQIDQATESVLASERHLSERISSVVLVDPIPILLHCPDVAYNFLYREPRNANEWQLWYFASRDPDTARVLGRYFFWSEAILWKEDLLCSDAESQPRMRWQGRIAILLSGADQIINSRSIWHYLTGDDTRKDFLDVQTPPKSAPHWESWLDDADDAVSRLEVHFYPGLDHATIFDTKERRKGILAVLDKFNTNGQ